MTTETCSNCGGSGLVRCHDCDHGYKANSWGDKVMCDCDEHFKRPCRQCAGTGEVEVEDKPEAQPSDTQATAMRDRIEALEHQAVELRESHQILSDLVQAQNLLIRDMWSDFIERGAKEPALGNGGAE